MGEPAMDEFESIARLFRPLTRGAPEAAELLDDAAFLLARPGFDMVATADAIVEGVHFLPGTAPDLVARKLLRVNLSDLAAKAAEPFGYLLAVAWPRAWGDAERAAFASGLAEDGERFAVKLLGGDTVSTPGPMSASVTALGYAEAGGAVRRAGAAPGDVVMVSGTIGDGWLGLLCARGELTLAAEHGDWLIDRYHLPRPRLALSSTLRAHATASLDVSDGLIADVGHLVRASGVAVELALERLPLSSAARIWTISQPDAAAAFTALAVGGDDYELAFTVPERAVEAVVTAANQTGVPVTAIGRVTSGQGVTATFKGAEVRPARAGWLHA